MRSTVPSARALSMRGNFTATRSRSASYPQLSGFSWKSTRASRSIEVTGMWPQPDSAGNPSMSKRMSQNHAARRMKRHLTFDRYLLS